MFFLIYQNADLNCPGGKVSVLYFSGSSNIMPAVTVFLSRQNPTASLNNFRGQIVADVNLHGSEYTKYATLLEAQGGQTECLTNVSALRLLCFLPCTCCCRADVTVLVLATQEAPITQGHRSFYCSVTLTSSKKVR